MSYYTKNICIDSMVLILDGNSGHVAHAWMKIGLFEPICDCSRSNQMP